VTYDYIGSSGRRIDKLHSEWIEAKAISVDAHDKIKALEHELALRKSAEADLRETLKALQQTVLDQMLEVASSHMKCAALRADLTEAHALSTQQQAVINHISSDLTELRSAFESLKAELTRDELMEAGDTPK